MALSSQRQIEQALEGVEGWFSPLEAWVLHESIRDLSPGREITVVEIGSSRGRSTIAAAHALLARAGGGILYAIDPQDDVAFEELRANLSRAGVESVVRPLRATSHEAREQFGAEPIDLIFIDGSHEYEDVRDDLRDWLPLLRPGGIVALNDPFWWGVPRALGERLLPGTPLRSPRLAHNTLFLSYLPEARWTRADGRELTRLRAAFLLGRVGATLLRVIGDARALPPRAKAGLLRAVGRTLVRLLSWVMPDAEA